MAIRILSCLRIPVLIGCAVALAGGLAARAAADEKPARADVVVVVDTSTSMREEGMDPQRASLLVTKLFADIVPGDLAVVRLLDLIDDAADLPSRDTGKTVPCDEDPTLDCNLVEPASDWEADARRKKLGALVRPGRGDAAYKKSLEGHLAQNAKNSPFNLALRAAQGVLESHDRFDVPRAVIWLSDGRSSDPPAVVKAISELRAGGTAVQAFVFGRGDPSLAEKAGLEPRRVASPAEIMKAFAGAFRGVVQAPFEIDAEIAGRPSFEMKPNVDEAWVVVYGDDSLAEAVLEGPAGTVATDHAADRWSGAGAYRVAYLKRPPAGRFTVSARGGGPGAAYAVVQRSALRPELVAPRQAVSGARVPLVAGVRAGLDGEFLSDSEVLAGTVFSAEFDGRSFTLVDDGTDGDAVAGDGRYTALVTFQGSGPTDVDVRLKSPVVDRATRATVDVSGVFRFSGEPPVVDLGTLKAGGTACRPLVFQAEREGEVPLELRAQRELPAHHMLGLRLGAGRLKAGGRALGSPPQDTFEVCLDTGRRAPDSTAAGETWLELGVAGSTEDDQQVPIALVWRVESLTFWELWGRLILMLLGVLVAAFVAGGFVWPYRFQRSLALTFVPDADELDEQSPQPIAQWQGVGIGFYRHARAYLQPDFRLSGKLQGALASLHAEKSATRVNVGRGGALFRETLDGDWEAVASPGRRVRPGDIYRVGENGPYFRISVQGGRR